MGSCSDRLKLILLLGAVAEWVSWTGVSLPTTAFVPEADLWGCSLRVSIAPLADASRGAEEADRERIIRVEGRSRPQARLRRLASALRLRHAPGASGRRRARDCRGGAAAQSRRAGDGPISRHRTRGRARKGGAPGRYALAPP